MFYNLIKYYLCYSSAVYKIFKKIPRSRNKTFQNKMNSNQVKLICFDLDKTIITENSWYNLNLSMGMTKEEDQKYYDQYYAEEITYQEWIKKLLDHFIKNGKATKGNIEKSLSSYELQPFAREVVEYLKLKGYKIALISGSINILVELVARDLSIEYFGGVNTFVFNESNYLKDIIVIDDDKVAKLEILIKFCRDLNISLDEVVCIGDGDNDIELFKATGKGITFTDSKIKEYSWKVIENLSDLKTIF